MRNCILRDGFRCRTFSLRVWFHDSHDAIVSRKIHQTICRNQRCTVVVPQSILPQSLAPESYRNSSLFRDRQPPCSLSATERAMVHNILLLHFARRHVCLVTSPEPSGTNRHYVMCGKSGSQVERLTVTNHGRDELFCRSFNQPVRRPCQWIKADDSFAAAHDHLILAVDCTNQRGTVTANSVFARNFPDKFTGFAIQCGDIRIAIMVTVDNEQMSGRSPGTAESMAHW